MELLATTIKFQERQLSRYLMKKESLILFQRILSLELPNQRLLHNLQIVVLLSSLNHSIKKKLTNGNSFKNQEFNLADQDVYYGLQRLIFNFRNLFTRISLKSHLLLQDSSRLLYTKKENQLNLKKKRERKEPNLMLMNISTKTLRKNGGLNTTKTLNSK